MTFSFPGLWRGFRMALPLAFGVAAYGLVFGMLAQQNGLRMIESLGMSLLVFAGASQIVAMDLWHAPLPMIGIVLTTFLVNARHLLMGMAIQPWLKPIRPWQAYGALFFCADENWALSVKQFQNGENDAAFLLGGGLAIYLGWNLATVLGFLGGVNLHNPAHYGIDFAFTAVFIALVVQMFRGKRDTLPWLTAAGAAWLTSYLLAGKWYILTGALSGALAAMMRYDKH